MLPILPTRHRQRGAVGLIAALFLILVVLIMGQVTLRLAATGANDSLLTHDGVGALLLAETGLERAAGQLGAGAACDAALAGSWGYAGGNVTIDDLGGGFVTDFDGSALAPGRCRIRATGSAGLYNARRTVEAIVSTAVGNLLDPNADFNDISCFFIFCRPVGWSVPFFSGWTWNEGVGGSPALEVAKSSGGAVETAAEHYPQTPFTVTAPTGLSVAFDYMTEAPSNQSVRVEFELWSGGTRYSAFRDYTGDTGGFVSDSITVDITGSGSVTIDRFGVVLTASAGQAKSLWLDNLVMTGPGGGSAGIARWREIIN